MDQIRVLIVDDEPDISFFLSRNLKKNDYATCMAGTLEEAEKLINTEFPNVILLDNHLPDGFGMDYARQIKSRYPDMKIIMITAHDSPQDRVTAIENGVDRFISKPFKIDEILHIVKDLSTKRLGM